MGRTEFAAIENGSIGEAPEDMLFRLGMMYATGAEVPAERGPHPQRGTILQMLFCLALLVAGLRYRSTRCCSPASARGKSIRVSQHGA